MNIRYYDIGLNLFTPSFPDPEKIIEDAEAAGVRCILTGSDRKDNELVNDFTKNTAFWAPPASIPTAPIRPVKKTFSASVKSS